jgi:nitroimidazol reductase NimA-like FMN-containing flavoprotein (pyridoxamine 5'-phosphate oxidase superfamily)
MVRLQGKSVEGFLWSCNLLKILIRFCSKGFWQPVVFNRETGGGIRLFFTLNTETDTMTDRERLKQRLQILFASQKLAVLSTQDQGQPYASLIAFAASEDLKELFFATPRATRKFSYLQANPRVALLMDSRSNQDSDIHQAIAATAVGIAAEVPAAERAKVLSCYLAKHPHLEEFAASPSCALVCVTVATYYVVSRFQEVMELHVTA